MSNLKQRLLGLVTTIALLGLVAGTPFLLLAVGAVPTPDGFGWARLTSPDDGTLALAVTVLASSQPTGRPVPATDAARGRAACRRQPGAGCTGE